jgi:nucleoside-diphosphate-sugar epimerase
VSRVLITGASGFVGRNCLPILVRKGYEVHAVSRKASPASIGPGVTWHETDLLAPGGATEIIQRVRPDSLLHLAWYATPGLFWEAQENVSWVRASVELMEAFAKHGGSRLVAAGSCAEYQPNVGECREDGTPLLPATLYGTCKNAFGAILRSASEQLKLSSAWGRIFFMYGPHEHPSRVVAYAVRCLLQGEPALCSDGRDIVDFLHVHDIAAAFVELLGSEVRGPVNIGSGRPTAIRDVLEEIGKQLQRPELLRFGARDSHREPSQLWANTQKLAKQLGWTPQYTLATGIRQTIEWCKTTSTAAA